jgi:AhpD family alkylhydroperoxidase
MFKKRIFTPESFARGIVGIIAGLPGSVDARRRKKISHAFAEKLRLATTSVNGCVYCSYGHSMLALRCGISKDEIDLLLKGEIGCEVDPFEAPGLLFAQHYAETGGRPAEEMLEKLRAAYGRETADDILAIIREMQFANLSGNTFDAFLSRLKGEAAEGSSLLFEASFFLVSLPVLGPFSLAMKVQKGVKRNPIWPEGEKNEKHK